MKTPSLGPPPSGPRSPGQSFPSWLRYGGHTHISHLAWSPCLDFLFLLYLGCCLHSVFKLLLIERLSEASYLHLGCLMSVHVTWHLTQGFSVQQAYCTLWATHDFPHNSSGRLWASARHTLGIQYRDCVGIDTCDQSLLKLDLVIFSTLHSVSKEWDPEWYLEMRTVIEPSYNS